MRSSFICISHVQCIFISGLTLFTRKQTGSCLNCFPSCERFESFRLSSKSVPWHYVWSECEFKDGKIKIKEIMRVWRYFRHGWRIWPLQLSAICFHVHHVCANRPPATCTSLLRSNSEIFLCFVFVAEQQYMFGMLQQLRKIWVSGRADECCDRGNNYLEKVIVPP